MIKVSQSNKQVEINVKGTPQELIKDLIALGALLADACGSKEVTDEFKSAFSFGIEKGLEAKENGIIYGKA